MKTLEQLAKLAHDYSEKFYGCEVTASDVNVAWYAGYETAQEHAHAALEEAEARIAELEDQVAEVSKVMDVSTSATLNNWISVKDRLPESQLGLLLVYHSYLNEVGTSYYDDDMWCSSPWPIASKHITHWMPLPEPPKEEG